MIDRCEDLVRRYDVRRVENGSSDRIVDVVAIEEPLEIRISYWFKDVPHTTALAVTMRTPGNDALLALGYLLSEGIICRREDLIEARSTSDNEVAIELSRDVDVETWRLARSGLLNASCGICGKRVLEAVETQVPARKHDALTWTPQLIGLLPDLLRSRQRGFSQTGGLHAAAAVSSAGEIQAEFEDIGRHNALDKLIGHALLNGSMPMSNQIILLSSRSSFELVQKAAMAGACAVATIGGPSSLAIEAARRWGITLVGFIREGHFNVYAGEWRIHS